MALEAFPCYLSTIYEGILPVYPIIAPDDLNNLFCSLVHEPTEESFTVVSQDFDIGFAATVLRLGHRLFEQTPAAAQLRYGGNTNIDQFEQCKWQRFAESTQTSTKLPWMIEGLSFTFLYHLCSGIPTGRLQTVLLSACEKQARYTLWSFHLFPVDKNIRIQEPITWNELAKLTGSWLMLL